MLHHAVAVFVVAQLAAACARDGGAAGAASIAKLLYLVFVVLAPIAFASTPKRTA